MVTRTLNGEIMPVLLRSLLKIPTLQLMTCNGLYLLLRLLALLEFNLQSNTTILMVALALELVRVYIHHVSIRNILPPFNLLEHLDSSKIMTPNLCLNLRDARRPLQLARHVAGQPMPTIKIVNVVDKVMNVPGREESRRSVLEAAILTCIMAITTKIPVLPVLGAELATLTRPSRTYLQSLRNTYNNHNE